MPEEERKFELKTERIEYIQEKVVKLLQEVLDYNTNIETYISFIDKNANTEYQKENSIVIIQNKENISVLVKGNMSEIQNDIIWSGLDKIINDLSNIEKTKKKEITEEELAQKIVERITEQGFVFKLEDAKRFIAYFQKKFSRVPKGEEVESIGIGYINMLIEGMKSEGEAIESIGIESVDVLKEELKVEAKSPKIKSQEDKNKELEVIQDSIKSIEPETKFVKKEDIKKNLDGIIEIKRIESRRSCPKCGNQNINAIKEFIDKNVIISNYPMMYGKKFQCRLCNCEWREL